MSSGRPVRLARNFLWLFLANVVGQVFNLVGLIHLARTWNPATFGLWNQGQAWMLYALRAGELGLEVIGIRTIARGVGGGVRRVVGNVLALRAGLAAGLLGIVLTAGWLGLFPEGTAGIISLLALTLLPTAFILEWVFEAHQSVAVVGAGRILKGVLFAVGVLAFVHGTGDLPLAAGLYVGSIAFAILVVGAFAVRRFSLYPLPAGRKGARELLTEAVPVGLATMLSQYNLFVGTVLGGYLLADDQVGQFSAAQRLVVFVWAYGIVTSNRVILPRLSRLHESSPADFAAFAARYFRLLVLVAVPLCVFGISGGPAAIELIYGAKYAESAVVLQILSVALAVGVACSVLEIALIASGRQKLFLKGMTGLAVVYTATTIAGMSLDGIRGAALAAVVSELAYLTFLLAAVPHVPALSLLRQLWRPVVAGLGSLGVLVAGGFRGIPGTLLLGGATYALLVFAVGGPTRDDVRSAWQSFGLARDAEDAAGDPADEHDNGPRPGTP